RRPSKTKTHGAPVVLFPLSIHAAVSLSRCSLSPLKTKTGAYHLSPLSQLVHMTGFDPRSTTSSEDIKAVLDVAMKAEHIILLSRTPSLSRPGLLGKDKYEFAKTYCYVKFGDRSRGKVFQMVLMSINCVFASSHFGFKEEKDFSIGARLEELNILLRQTVMGCISVSMSLYRTSFCFICSHLASGEK
ncbi:hypothetical protein Dimus_001732, partial [Dionaea muscipula]